MAKYNPISVAVIDLFASSLGAFMILYFVSLPFTEIEPVTPSQKVEQNDFMSKLNLQDASKVTGFYHLQSLCNGGMFNWKLSFWGEESGYMRYQSQSSIGDLVLSQSFLAYYMANNQMADVRVEILKEVGDWGGPGLSMVTTYVYPDKVELHNHSCVETDGPIIIPKISGIPQELEND